MSNIQTIGDYKYSTDIIGKGTFSVVYKGYHKETLENVAIKKIIFGNATTVNSKIAQQEKSIMEKLLHPNIVKFIEATLDAENNIHYVFEYCECGTLAHFLNGKPLKEKYALGYMKQLANALHYLVENQIIHRDLKPQNILLTNNYKTLKLADFGFAKYLRTETNTNSTGFGKPYSISSKSHVETDSVEQLCETICGSPIYMSPEIIKSCCYNNKSDLWSVGIILYEMITGTTPYKAYNHIDLLHKIETQPISIPLALMNSAECKDLIYCLLQKRPENRIDWNAFFEHKWFSGKMEKPSAKINIDNLIIDYDYRGNSDLKNEENRNTSTYVKIQTQPKSSPILINPIKCTQTITSNTSEETREKDIGGTSPPFVSPSRMTNIEENKIIIVNPSDNDDSDSETERDISQSLLDYMGNTFNYLKSFYR